jgi:uncharacterized protein (TIGR02266 family)
MVNAGRGSSTAGARFSPENEGVRSASSCIPKQENGPCRSSPKADRTGNDERETMEREDGARRIDLTEPPFAPFPEHQMPSLAAVVFPTELHSNHRLSRFPMYAYSNAHLNAPQSAFSNQRAHARREIELEVTLVSESNLYMGLTENLSEGGVFVATHARMPPGTAIQLKLSFDGCEPLEILGEVVWLREYSESSDTEPGMGIRFVSLDPAAAARIHEFLARRAPLFFESDI